MSWLKLGGVHNVLWVHERTYILDVSEYAEKCKSPSAQHKPQTMAAYLFAACNSLCSILCLELQDHCIAALLRLNRKQILRLHSPEDFIQVLLSMHPDSQLVD